jgi:Putative adhesin
VGQWKVADPQRIPFDGEVQRLEISLARGRVSVVGTPGPARLEVSAVGRKPVMIDHNDGVIAIRHWTAGKRNPFYWWLFGKRYSCEMTIAVPPEIAADVTVVQGRVALSGLQTQTTVDVTSGKISLLGLAGRTRAKLVSGPVEALGVGGDLTMETVSGDLTLAQSSAERVHAVTVSGSITCDVDSSTPADIRLTTTSGDIAVRVPSGADLDVRLAAVAGRVTTAFPLDSEGFGRWNKAVRGRLGTGGGRLDATSTSGSVALLAGE